MLHFLGYLWIPIIACVFVIALLAYFGLKWLVDNFGTDEFGE